MKNTNTKPTLWNKNFTLITFGTIVSCLGSVAMNIALGLVVFDQTKSTALTGLYAFATTFPSIVLPVFFAPYIDSHKRKNIIVFLDSLLAICYFVFAFITWKTGFFYWQYILFGMLTSAIGSVYIAAYRALFPSLIPNGFAQKGYSVSSMIYPSVAILGTPLTAIVYTNMSISVVFFAVGISLTIASMFEMQIKVTEENLSPIQKLDLVNYLKELKIGYTYLKEEKGVRYLYANLAIINSTAQGNNMMEMAYFQTSPLLSTTMYSLLLSAETIGRTVGGLVHYLIKIPANKKYSFTQLTYFTYDTLDGFLLFMPYAGMIIAKFICGFLGVNSATMRETALQQRLPNDKRARINSTLGAITGGMQMITVLLTGIMAEFLPYRFVAVFFTVIALLTTYLLLVRKKADVAVVLNVE